MALLFARWHSVVAVGLLAAACTGANPAFTGALGVDGPGPEASDAGSGPAPGGAGGAGGAVGTGDGAPSEPGVGGQGAAEGGTSGSDGGGESAASLDGGSGVLDSATERADVPRPPPDLAADTAVADAGAPDRAPDMVPDLAPDRASDLAPDLPPATINGAFGEYYAGREFERLIGARLDPTINFNWVHDPPMVGVPEEMFSIRWRFEILPRYSELYTLHVTSDDGARLWVDGTLVVNAWVDQSGEENTGQIPLQAGRRHQVILEYYDRALTALVRFAWSSPSQMEQIVPNDRLFSR